MSETALKFGPEWLRALSHGGSLSSPPSSPGPVRFKLADYRYGREEMLALFSKDFPPPDGLQGSLGSLCIEQMQEPLAFLPMNLEEQNGSLPNDWHISSNVFSRDYLKRVDSSVSPLQRIWQRCVNSEAVLRGSGRASINGVGRGRGGSVDRGRGRGRGVGAPYYSRGLSYDEDPEIRGSRESGPPGMPLRNKSYERSQSMGDSRGWAGERAPMERAPGVGEERSGAASPQKGRAATDNWRSRASEEEGGDRWRGLVHSRNEKWGNRGGWREREGVNEADWEDGRGQPPPIGTMRNSRPPSWDTDRDKEGQRRHWEDDNLPEWATETAEDKGGSFDATGAFHAPGSSDEDDAEREEFSPPKEPHEDERVLKPEKAIREKEEKNDPKERDWSEDMKMKAGSDVKSLQGGLIEGDDCDVDTGPSHLPLVNGILSEEETNALCSRSTPVAPSKESPAPFPPTAPPSVIQPPIEELEERREEDKLEHMQSVADDLVAKLVEEDDPRPLGVARTRMHHPPPGGFIPSEPIPPPEEQWYYTDPQGDIQGPFSSVDMAAWYKAGYFKATLLLRRQCDDKFAQLGDLTTLFGRIPFLPGPTVPPLKVSDLINAQKAQAERERYEMMQAQIMQKQLYQQQNSLRQQQVLQTLQSLEDWGRLSAAQQQQLFVQHMMALPPLVPPTLPVSLHTATPTTAHSAHTQPPAPDLRGSLSTSGAPPPLPPQPDPIQAFVAQMATSSSSPSVSVPASSDTPVPQPPPSSSPIGAESPLQKLLLQLQRSSQAAGLATSAPAPIVSGHPSSMATAPPPAAISLEKGPPDQQYDAIQSLMNQLTKLQIQPPDTLQDEQRQREEEQKRIEDERRQFEEQKRAEEERIKIQEIRLQEERLKEEERRKELEAKNQRLEEELRRIQEEQLRRRREEENRVKEAEKKKLEHQQKLAEANKRDEEQKRQLKKQRQEEETRKREEARKAEEARKLAEEDERRKEEQRIKAEEKRKEEEERKRKEEKERQQQIQVQEEMRRIALEEERRRMQQLEEEERRKQHQEEQTRRQQKQEQEQQRQEQQQQRQEQQQQRQEQQQQRQEQQQQRQEQQQQRQEQQQQRQAQQQQQKQAQLQQQAYQQQQKATVQEKAKPTAPAWNNAQTSQDKNTAPSLAEIQKAQEIKERKEREAEAHRESQRQKEAQRQAAEEKKQKEANIKWAARVSQSGKGGSKNVMGQPSQPPIKSLLEIQKEEEKELKKRQEKEQAERAAAISHLSLNAAGVWGSAAQSLSWANRASSGTTPSLPISNPQGPQQAWGSSSNTMAWSTIAQSNPSSGWNSESSSSSWNQGSNQNSGGFWESPDSVKGPLKSSGTATNSNRSPPKGHANQSQSSNKCAGVQAVNSNNKTNKKKNKDESENVKKLFADSISPADNFTQWCKASLHSMKVHASIDIPTFVGFLADVESPYEVHDYIRSYLGDSKEVKEFAKQYLERRSKARNAQKEKHEDDNILAPAPAVNPGSSLEFQEVKSNVYSVHSQTRLKRGRKKMQKVDNSILGFNVSSLERVDVEDGN